MESGVFAMASNGIDAHGRAVIPFHATEAEDHEIAQAGCKSLERSYSRLA